MDCDVRRSNEGVSMFIKLGDTTYLASPLHKEAGRLLRALDERRISASVAIATNATAAVSILCGIMLLVRGVVTPEVWPQYGSANDWTGVGLFVVCALLAAGSWVGARVFDMKFRQEYRLRSLVRASQIIEIPRPLNETLYGKLMELELDEFAQKAYQLTMHDYEVLREAAQTTHKGIVTPDLAETSISPLLDELVARIKYSYDAAQMEHGWKLQALRMDTIGEIEG